VGAIDQSASSFGAIGANRETASLARRPAGVRACRETAGSQYGAGLLSYFLSLSLSRARARSLSLRHWLSLLSLAPTDSLAHSFTAFAHSLLFFSPGSLCLLPTTFAHFPPFLPFFLSLFSITHRTHASIVHVVPPTSIRSFYPLPSRLTPRIRVDKSRIVHLKIARVFAKLAREPFFINLRHYFRNSSIPTRSYRPP